jgi:coenzyme F420-reducing hydrogenase beta subunit
MDKKVGILTLYFQTYNYGAQLQAYALQKVVSELGYPCEQITFDWQNFDGKMIYADWLENGRSFSDSIKHFSNTIPHSETVYTPETLQQCADKYDVFICGSDQIWAWPLRGMSVETASMFFLRFVPDEKTKIAYAASLGGKEFRPACLPILREGISRLDAISVRESSAIAAVSKYAKNNVCSVLDPVMLLSPQQWEDIAAYPETAREGKYLLFYHLGSRNSEHIANDLAEQMGLRLIAVRFDENDVGPPELVGLIKNADFVFTDSFHGTVLSILFNKQFFVTNISTDITEQSRNIRLTDILDKFGLQARLLKNPLNPQAIKNIPIIDYTDVNIALHQKREDSKVFLRKALSIKKTVPSTIMPIKPSQCCGCGACANVCPAGCIEMQPDELLAFPNPNIAEASCLNCGKCREVCPVLNPFVPDSAKTPEAYAAYALDDDLRMESSSGGVFSLLAEKIIQEEAGVVFGALFDDDMRVKHDFATSTEGLAKFRGSKYVQSDTGKTYKQAKEFLDDGKTVLYSGTPCQIEGLKRFLGRNYEKLLTIDLICHGVASPALWAKYVCEKCEKNDKKIKTAFFRDKKYGWFSASAAAGVSGSMKLTYSDGSQEVTPCLSDSYLYLFLKNAFLRESCYHCKAKKTNRASDITIADFWSVESLCPEMFDGKGTSLVVLHSERGRKLFRDVSLLIRNKSVDFDKAISGNPMMVQSAVAPQYRPYLLSLMKEWTIGELYYENMLSDQRIQTETAWLTCAYAEARSELLLKLERFSSFGYSLARIPAIKGKVLIYGAGKVGRIACHLLDGTMSGFIDKSPVFVDMPFFEGFPVYHPDSDELKTMLSHAPEVTVLVTPVWDFKTIKNELKFPKSVHIISVSDILRNI